MWWSFEVPFNPSFSVIPQFYHSNTVTPFKAREMYEFYLKFLAILYCLQWQHTENSVFFTGCDNMVEEHSIVEKLKKKKSNPNHYHYSFLEYVFPNTKSLHVSVTDTFTGPLFHLLFLQHFFYVFKHTSIFNGWRYLERKNMQKHLMIDWCPSTVNQFYFWISESSKSNIQKQ